MKQRTMMIRMRTALSLGLFAVFLALSLGGAQGSGVTPTNIWMDLYGSHSSFAGVPIPAGSYVAVFDPQNVQCAERTVTTPGYIAPIMPCYGDNINTPADEGALEGDLLMFAINGTLATTQARAHNFVPVPPHTPVRWHALDVWEVDLVVPPQPLVTISHAPGQTQLAWQPASVPVSQYEVWRSTNPYFIPGGDDSMKIGTVLPGQAFVWLDTDGAGDPAVNNTYRVVSLNASSQIVGVSQAVGEFDFVLHR